MQPGLLEHVRAHHQVRVPVAARVGAVRADPAHLGGEVEDELRARVVEEAGRRVHRRQVVVAPARREHIVAVRLEPLDESRAEEAAASGDERPHVASPGLCARYVSASTVSKRLGARCTARLTRRVSGSGLVPIRFGRIERSPASILKPPAFAARPDSTSSASTSPRVQNLRKCGGRNRSGFSRGGKLGGLNEFGNETSKTKSPPGFSVRAISATARRRSSCPCAGRRRS